MTESSSKWNRRIARLCGAVGAVTVSRGGVADSVDSLIAVTSSRLGHDPALHRHVCLFLCRSLLDCRQRHASLLVASGSAIEPWALRAAELFAVPVVRLSVDAKDETADIVVRPVEGERLSRDAVLIAVADRVDAVYVRRGGTIDDCLRRRIDERGDASTRVAVSMMPKCAAAGLIAAGAIGWFHVRDKAGTGNVEGSTLDRTEFEQNVADDAWTRTDGKWLVHCTRGCDGAWPGETERQYRDSILIGDESSIRRAPLDALARIVRSGQLVAAATATMKKHPVVCFSALPLQELLQRRCFRPQLGRWDYEPYGIAIRLALAQRLGIQPVVYGDPKNRSTLSAEEQYRFHPIGNTFDWREEREWRSSASVDLAAIDPNDVRVFADDNQAARSRLQGCQWPLTFVSATAAKQQSVVTEAEKQV